LRQASSAVRRRSAEIRLLDNSAFRFLWDDGVLYFFDINDLSVDFFAIPFVQRNEEGMGGSQTIFIDWRVMPNATHSGSFAVSQELERMQ